MPSDQTTIRADAAIPLVEAIWNLRAARQSAEAAVQSYRGFEGSPHYAPWVERVRLLDRAEAALRGVLADG